MFQTSISRHNSNFFSDKLVLTSVTPASSAPVLQTPKATSSRSEERFSRNAETDLVCRLLLEKKNSRLCTPRRQPGKSYSRTPFPRRSQITYRHFLHRDF